MYTYIHTYTPSTSFLNYRCLQLFLHVCGRAITGRHKIARNAIKTALVIADPKMLFQGIPYHPNIVGLRGMSEGGRFDPRFFIIIDRLKETLETRPKRWRLNADDMPTTHTHGKTCCLPFLRKDKRRRSPSTNIAMQNANTESTLIWYLPWHI
jgi:hypothetical protein